MGQQFNSVKPAVLKEADLIADIMYTATIMLLNNNNDEYADDLMLITKNILDVIDNKDIVNNESALHNLLEEQISDQIKKQDFLVQASLERLFTRAFTLLAEKIDTIDTDDILSDDERQAQRKVFQAIHDAAETTYNYYNKK